MKRFGTILGIKIGLAIFCACMALSAPAFAEDAKPAGLNPDDLKKALGLSIYLQGGYTYNGNASSHQAFLARKTICAATTTRQTASASIWRRSCSPKTLQRGVIGYKVKVSTGETAKLIHASGLGTQPTGTANPESFDITEAYISYTAPIGKGLRFDMGKMVTFVGAEMVEAIDSPELFPVIPVRLCGTDDAYRGEGELCIQRQRERGLVRCERLGQCNGQQ